jgi:tartrate dehydrogenase/decarboxylase/D-malate dehydrogenase
MGILGPAGLGRRVGLRYLAPQTPLPIGAEEVRKVRRNNLRIAAIPGDGIGVEVIDAGCRVLHALADSIPDLDLVIERLDWGSERYLATGSMMPGDGLETLRGFDAILFGSAGDPRVPDHVTLWGLRLAICQGLDQYANVRPSRLLPGIKSPLADVSSRDLDWVIVRENSEGEYSGAGGQVHRGFPHAVGLDVTVMTRAGVERIMRFAFELALGRPRRKLTMVTKSNAQRHAMVMWDDIFEVVRADYIGVEADRMLVDAMTTRMVLRPASIDVVVATNLHADILSDLAAALSGSLGIAPTGNLNPDPDVPSMFEPIHGSAFDIVGKGMANPIGTFWSIVMMLEHLGHKQASRRLMAAIERTTAGKVLTPDLGGAAGTGEVTKALLAALDYQRPA